MSDRISSVSFWKKPDQIVLSTTYNSGILCSVYSHMNPAQFARNLIVCGLNIDMEYNGLSQELMKMPIDSVVETISTAYIWTLQDTIANYIEESNPCEQNIAVELEAGMWLTHGGKAWDLQRLFILSVINDHEAVMNGELFRFTYNIVDGESACKLWLIDEQLTKPPYIIRKPPERMAQVGLNVKE